MDDIDLPTHPNDGHIFGSAEAKLWFGAIDDLWKMGSPHGKGGPWRGTAVKTNEPSDPYLLTGDEHKTLTLSHDAKEPVEFTVQVDFYADGQWHDYQHLTVEPGKPFMHEFPRSYSAHWVRVKSTANCIADAQLEYR